MSLDTQQFGISRFWLSVALAELPSRPDIFGSSQLKAARKCFLAGGNQLKAIRSWLTNADIVKSAGRQVLLTKLGELVSTKDRRGRDPWTWWLFHIHLCANREAYPYCTFFTQLDADGGGWMTIDEVIEFLTKTLKESAVAVERGSVESYFRGVELAFRPGASLYGLGLIEWREDNAGGQRLRRRLAKPPLFVVAYAALAFQQAFFENQVTIEMRVLLQKGLARALGLRDADVRETLSHLNQDAGLSRIMQYKQVANLDSMQFVEPSELVLRRLAAQAYAQGEIQWQ